MLDAADDISSHLFRDKTSDRFRNIGPDLDLRCLTLVEFLKCFVYFYLLDLILRVNIFQLCWDGSSLVDQVPSND